MERDERLIEELNLPILSFRLFAAQQAVREGASPKLLAALEARLPLEDNEECRSLIGFAVREVKKRLKKQADAAAAATAAPGPASTPASSSSSAVTAPVAKSSVTAGTFPDQEIHEKDFLTLSTSAKVSFLAGLHRLGIEHFLEQGKQWLAAPCEPAVTTLLLRIFGPHLPKDALGLLEPHLLSPSFTIRSTALSLLLNRDPERLRDRLPGFLASDDAGIRAMAIQGLSRIDSDEAVNHCVLMLRDASSEKRLAALKVVVHLPPRSIRDHLLAFLVVEKNPGLIRQAALLLQFNPDPQLPFHLWEIIERSSGEKVTILRDALRETCRNLHWPV